jgi:hypothetical protein
MTKVRVLFSLVSATLILSFLAADAMADEMSWELKNKSKKVCKLENGMTLKRGLDFVETKRLMCKEEGEVSYRFVSTVSCGPEGSVTRFGKKVKVTCHTTWYAAK